MKNRWIDALEVVAFVAAVVVVWMVVPVPA